MAPLFMERVTLPRSQAITAILLEATQNQAIAVAGFRSGNSVIRRRRSIQEGQVQPGAAGHCTMCGDADVRGF
jgi:hypothetical protein